MTVGKLIAILKDFPEKFKIIARDKNGNIENAIYIEFSYQKETIFISGING